MQHQAKRLRLDIPSFYHTSLPIFPNDIWFHLLQYLSGTAVLQQFLPLCRAWYECLIKDVEFSGAFWREKLKLEFGIEFQSCTNNTSFCFPYLYKIFYYEKKFKFGLFSPTQMWDDRVYLTTDEVTCHVQYFETKVLDAHIPSVIDLKFIGLENQFRENLLLFLVKKGIPIQKSKSITRKESFPNSHSVEQLVSQYHIQYICKQFIWSGVAMLLKRQPTKMERREARLVWETIMKQHFDSNYLKFFNALQNACVFQELMRLIWEQLQQFYDNQNRRKQFVFLAMQQLSKQLYCKYHIHLLEDSIFRNHISQFKPILHNIWYSQPDILYRDLEYIEHQVMQTYFTIKAKEHQKSCKTHHQHSANRICGKKRSLEEMQVQFQDFEFC